MLAGSRNKARNKKGSLSDELARDVRTKDVRNSWMTVRLGNIQRIGKRCTEIIRWVWV